MKTNDFENFGSFSSWDTLAPNQQDNNTAPVNETHGWHWPQTLLSLVLVSGLAFLMAYLTRNIDQRSTLLMGLIFMIPAGAMFLASLIMEYSLNAMTPSTSRNVQVKIAAGTICAVFLIACLCNGIYLHGGFVGDSSDNLMFLVYQKGAEGNSATDQAVMSVLDDLQKRSGDRVQVGIFKFDFANQNTHENNDTVIPLAPFTKDHRDLIHSALIGGEKVTASQYGHDVAYEMIENSGTQKHTRVIFICETPVTYGDGDYTINEWNRDVERMKNANISISFMGHGEPDEGMVYMVENTGGVMITDYNAETFLKNLQLITHVESDILRSSSTSAKVLSGIMLMLEGLVIGVGLSLLLSLRKQLRLQMLITPVMAAIAFVLVKFLPIDGLAYWVKEGIAFSLLGVIFMKKNYAFGKKIQSSAFKAPDFNSGGDPFGSSSF